MTRSIAGLSAAAELLVGQPAGIGACKRYVDVMPSPVELYRHARDRNDVS